MKNIILILLTVSLFSHTYGQDCGVVGTWEGLDEEVIGSMQFDSLGYAYLIINGEKLGGSSYNMDGVDASLTYNIDCSKSPYLIDFVITINSTNSQFDMIKGIFEFQDDKSKIKICVNFEGGDRPDQFIEEDTIVLTKK